MSVRPLVEPSTDLHGYDLNSGTVLDTLNCGAEQATSLEEVQGRSPGRKDCPLPCDRDPRHEKN